MKTQADIEARLRELLVTELDRRVTEASKKLPHHCLHNIRQPLDTRKTVDGEPNPTFNRITTDGHLPVVQTIGLCGLGKEDPTTWNGTICEDPIDAQNCRYKAFEPRFTEDEIWEELAKQFRDPEWAAENLPEATTLAWALGKVELANETSRATILYEQVGIVEDAAKEGLYLGPELPWWKRVVLRWLKIETMGIRMVAPQLPAPRAEDDDPSLGS